MMAMVAAAKWAAVLNILIAPAGAASVSHEFSCSYSDDARNISLDGPCTLTETTINGNFSYFMDLRGQRVTIEYVKDSGADHVWKINGHPALGYEIDREHLHGATVDLNENVEWQDRPEAEAKAEMDRTAAEAAASSPEIAAPKPNDRQARSCAESWSACSDTQDVVDHWSGYVHVRAACQIEAEDRARYGHPIWPGFLSGGAFASFETAGNAARSGRIVAVEPDAQFQNGFGAMAHAVVRCTFDLKSDRVASIEIQPR